MGRVEKSPHPLAKPSIVCTAGWQITSINALKQCVLEEKGMDVLREGRFVNIAHKSFSAAFTVQY